MRCTTHIPVMIGFSIRKSIIKRRADKTIYSRVIVCSSQGYAETGSSHATTRTGCKDLIKFSVSREGVWTVQKIELDHNYILATPKKKHMLRSQRHVIDADRQLIAQIREAGMRPMQVYEFMKQFYGGADKVPFLRMDCNNEIGRERNKYLESNDAQILLEYPKNKQIEDPAFFYAMEIDKQDGRIANFFWADGQSIMDYVCFGDAVSFDTTFQTNKFEMPFAPLLGTNHHKQTIIFGAALLFNETIESFIWLFQTFLTAMSGKHPSTIFTDQDAAMAGAITYVFPNTSHRLCLWHIYLNVAKHLGHVIHKDPDFLYAFKGCVYEDRSEEYFIKKWNELLTKYDLKENSWLLNLYDLRRRWAAVYRTSFTADMTTTQRSEGMNNVFKKRFCRKFGISELLVECDKVSASLRENELDEDFQSLIKIPVNYLSNLPLLKTATESYTRRMYAEFEVEFRKQHEYSCKLL
jgi:zinc finger SWIM domain-containing protein 3